MNHRVVFTLEETRCKAQKYPKYPLITTREARDGDR